MLFSSLRSIRTPKPVLDVYQSSQHISALCINTSQAQTKIHITAQNVVSAVWNDIYYEIPRFLFVSWYSCFLKSKEVIGLLQYQVLPYEWKENSSVSLRARATLNRRERRPDRYTHETYHFQCFLIHLCEIVIKKYWAVLNASFCFLIGIRFPFIRSNRVQI